MPLNATSFLVSQGWEGVGVPLDGKAGKGLKKPLAITQKKTLSGIGKDRDRADDWWNSIFTASAKSLSIAPSPSSSGASTPTLDKPKASGSGTSWNMSERSAGTATMSLSSLAKREHARKTLMSNFVRGKPIVPAVEVEPRKPAEVVAASDAEAESALNVASSSSSGTTPPGDKDNERLEKKFAKRALRKQLSEAGEPNQKKSKKAREDKKEKKGKKDKKDKKANKTTELQGSSVALPLKDTSLSKKRKRKRDLQSVEVNSVETTKDKKDKRGRKDEGDKRDKREKKAKKPNMEKKQRLDKDKDNVD
ncbi:hypothetical protein NDA13_001066 [Ustilago tritici]|nr:hypothetical protein NDA13_001066 [Ustilago tritici]